LRNKDCEPESSRSSPSRIGALAAPNRRAIRVLEIFGTLGAIFLERALQLLATFIAYWGSASLVASWRQAPLGYAKPMLQSLREIESLARRAIFDLAQTLTVRAFRARGPRPSQAKIPVDVVVLDPLAFRRAMLGGDVLPRISFVPAQAWEQPAEEWNVRFCVVGGRRVLPGPSA
jgi:hypothetical protein